jgi:type I restriction enzyme M protein
MSAKRDKYFRDSTKGAVYTPMELSHRIMDLLDPEIFRPGKTILDPACGAGNLLIAAAERKLLDGCSVEDIASTLYGIDINTEAIEECIIRLMELLGSEYEFIIRDNIVVGDFLED